MLVQYVANEVCHHMIQACVRNCKLLFLRMGRSGIQFIYICIPDPPQCFASYITSQQQCTKFHALKLSQRHVLTSMDTFLRVATSTYYVIFAFNLNGSSREKSTHGLRFAFAQLLVYWTISLVMAFWWPIVHDTCSFLRMTVNDVLVSVLCDTYVGVTVNSNAILIVRDSEKILPGGTKTDTGTLYFLAPSPKLV